MKEDLLEISLWFVLAFVIGGSIIHSMPALAQTSGVVSMNNLEQQEIHMVQNDYGDVITTFTNNHGAGIHGLQCDEFRGPILSKLPLGVIEQTPAMPWAKTQSAPSPGTRSLTENSFTRVGDPLGLVDTGAFDFFHIDGGTNEIDRDKASFNRASFPGETEVRTDCRIMQGEFAYTNVYRNSRGSTWTGCSQVTNPLVCPRAGTEDDPVYDPDVLRTTGTRRPVTWFYTGGSCSGDTTTLSGLYVATGGGYRGGISAEEPYAIASARVWEMGTRSLSNLDDVQSFSGTRKAAIDMRAGHLRIDDNPELWVAVRIPEHITGAVTIRISHVHDVDINRDLNESLLANAVKDYKIVGTGDALVKHVIDTDHLDAANTIRITWYADGERRESGNFYSLSGVLLMPGFVTYPKDFPQNTNGFALVGAGHRYGATAQNQVGNMFVHIRGAGPELGNPTMNEPINSEVLTLRESAFETVGSIIMNTAAVYVQTDKVLDEPTYGSRVDTLWYEVTPFIDTNPTQSSINNNQILIPRHLVDDFDKLTCTGFTFNQMATAVGSPKLNLNIVESSIPPGDLPGPAEDLGVKITDLFGGSEGGTIVPATPRVRIGELGTDDSVTGGVRSEIARTEVSIQFNMTGSGNNSILGTPDCDISSAISLKPFEYQFKKSGAAYVTEFNVHKQDVVEFICKVPTEKGTIDYRTRSFAYEPIFHELVSNLLEDNILGTGDLRFGSVPLMATIWVIFSFAGYTRSHLPSAVIVSGAILFAGSYFGILNLPLAVLTGMVSVLILVIFNRGTQS